MDDQVAGPSRSKKRHTDYENKSALEDCDSKPLLNLSDSEDDPFFGSDSEYGLLDESSEEDEDTILQDVHNSNNVEDSVLTNVNNQGVNIWTDIPDFQHIGFSGIPGLRANMTSDDPFDFFQLLITDDFLQHIVEETSNYAEEVFLSQNNKKSRITQWKPLTLSEFKGFLGLWLHMGHIDINRIQDYWKTDELYGIPCFQKHISRNRFQLIMSCLHFSKNPQRGEPGFNDRLYKIRYLEDYVNNKMSEIYYPGKELSLDEFMLLWRGRLTFRQCIKNKYGIKLYILTEPNGLVLKIRTSSRAEGDMSGKGHPANVVLALMREYLNSGHSLFIDNFYNSYFLSRLLLENNTFVTGTLRNNRQGNPKEVVTAKLQKGEVITKYSNGVAIGKWRDKREVLFLSTEFGSEMIEQESRRGEKKQKPKAIAMYIKYMSGIDRQDQMLSYYNSDRKTIRWYKKLAIHFISILTLNSFYLYNRYSLKEKLSYYDFRHCIVRKLLSQIEKPRPIKSNAKIQSQPTISHVAEKMQKDKNGTQMRKRCRVCYECNIRKQTPYFCQSCDGSPGLCLGDCFRTYHAKKPESK